MKFLKAIARGFLFILNGDFYNFRRHIVWPYSSYKRGMLKRVQKYYKYKYFVETGTYLGDTPSELSKYFEHVWTIELDEKLYENAKKKLSKYINVECLNGDSKNCLKQLVSKIDAPAIFWLDGHYSGGVTAMGELAAPILQELEAIGSSEIKSHIIIIDDISDFCVAEGNARLSEILRSIESINEKYKVYFDYDMLFALPYEPSHREFWRKLAYPFVIR